MILSKILSFLCVLSLIFGTVVELQLLLIDISFGCFNLTFVSRCLIVLFTVISSFSLFLEIINVQVRCLPRKLWCILVWLIVFIGLLDFKFSNSDNSLNRNDDALIGQFESNWNNNMDVLLDIYKCQLDSLCLGPLSDISFFYEHLDYEQANCLLDSLLKIKNNFELVDIQLLFQIRKSSLKISNEALENLVKEPDSCARELWMLAFSERGYLEYEFKNACHIKRFEVFKPTAEQLNDYLIHEFDYEANDNKNLSTAFVRKNKRLQKMYKVEGLCAGQIARLNEKGVVVDISIQLKDSNRECWIGNRMFSYYRYVGEKYNQFKMTPPTKIVRSNEIVYPLFQSSYDEPKLRYMPLLDRDTVLLQWFGLKSDSLAKKTIDEKKYYDEINLKFPKVVLYDSFTKISKGQSMVIDIPCLSENEAKAYAIFDIISPFFPTLRCYIAPASKDYIAEH